MSRCPGPSGEGSTRARPRCILPRVPSHRPIACRERRPCLGPALARWAAGPRLAALAGALALATSSVASAHVRAPSSAPDPAPAADPALDEAQALYADGLTDYETLDYDLAIEKWKEALGRLREARPQSPEQESSVAAARNAIVYNIASAQEKAYAQDKDVARLKKARGLLERYVEEYVAAGGDDADELSRARARIDELGARIDDAERQSAAARERRTTITPADTGSTTRRRAGRGLTIGGSVALVAGIGLVAGGVTAGVLMTRRAEDRIPELDELADEGARQDQLDRGRRGDIITIACAVSGGALALAGIGMIAAGAAKSKQASRRAAVPMLGPGFAGLLLRTRF